MTNHPELAQGRKSLRRAVSVAVLVLAADLLGGRTAQCTTLDLTAPQTGAVLKGAIKVTAKSSWYLGLGYFTLSVDGVQKQTKTNSGTFTLDTTSLKDGAHRLSIAVKVVGVPLGSANDSVSVVVDNNAPSLSIFSPNSDGQTVQGVTVIKAGASDAVGLRSVELYVDGTYKAYTLGNSQRSMDLNISLDTNSLSNGTHVIKLRANDTSGNARDGVRSVIVNNPDQVLPTVAFTNPSYEGQPLSGAVSVQGIAADNIGLRKVELYADGAYMGNVQGNDSKAISFGVALNSRALANGMRTLTLRAYDTSGNAREASRKVNVDNVDKVPPSVGFVSPSVDGQIAKGTIRIQGTASDNIGMSRVELHVDGAFRNSESGGGALSMLLNMPFDTTQLSEGSHTLLLKARDTSGNIRDASRAIIVGNGDKMPPVLSNVSPTEIAYTEAKITWTTDEPADSQVEYGTTASYGKMTALNPSLLTAHSRSLSGLATGTLYHYRVRSRDAAGNAAVSGDHTFVTASAAYIPPTVSITSPGEGKTISGVVYIQGTAFGSRGITKVKLYRYDQLIAETALDGAQNTEFAVKFDTRKVLDAEYVLRVAAMDAAGVWSEMASVSVFIANLKFQSAMVVDNGPIAKKANIVFLGDGYAAAEMDTYRKDVQEFADYLFKQPPFSDYKDFFNVHRVDVISRQSGTDNPKCNGAQVDTALDTVFKSDQDGGCRALFTESAGKVAVAAANARVGNPVVIIIVNTSVYGGAARLGQYGVFYRGGKDTMVHELGHSFGMLADEYDYGGPEVYAQSEPSEPNITVNTDRLTLKWREWVDPSTVMPTVDNEADTPGLYQGAKYSKRGIYRPTYNSKMRDSSQEFESVDYSLLAERIFHFAGDDVTPPQLGFNCAKPVLGTVAIRLAATDTESFVLAYRVSTSPSFADAPWKLASNAPDFNLEDRLWWSAGVGNAPSLYAQVMNGSGKPSAKVSCNIRGAASAAITSPADGATVRDNVAIAVSTSVGVRRVELYVDDSTSPKVTDAASFLLDTKGLSSGAHVLTVKAYGETLEDTAEHSIRINISSSPAPAAVRIDPPVASIRSSMGGSAGPVEVVVSVGSRTDVSRVELYVDGDLRGSIASTPYEFSLEASQLGDGPHVLIAKAFDADGNSAEHQMDFAADAGRSRWNVLKNAWTIGETGGDIADAQTGARLSFPANALAGRTLVSVSRLTESIPDPDGTAVAQETGNVPPLRRIGDGFEFLPEGIQFPNPVLLRTRIADCGSMVSPALYHWDPASRSWNRLPSSAFDRSTCELTASLVHFSIYAVFDAVAAVAPVALRVGQAYVFPNPARGEQRPTIHVPAENASEAEIRVYDVTGALIHKSAMNASPVPVLRGGVLESAYEYQWPADGAGSGIYFYAVDIRGSGASSKLKGKFVLIR